MNAGKLMKKKKIVLPIMVLTVLASQLAGCASFSSKEMVNMINAGEPITIEVAVPDYQTSVLGTQETATDWTQLDQLKTYNDFRLNFDTMLNINTITSESINGKSGCIYTNEAGETDGNTTLEDAFRNRAFVEKYWAESRLTNKLMKLAVMAYKDVDGTKTDSLYASINAYYDLLTDNVDPSSFNATRSVTREQFYALVFKSCEGVQQLQNDSDYTDATGGTTDYSIYAQQVQDDAFLNTTNNCLDKNNVGGSISRAEAVYMVVNKFYPNIKGSTLNIDVVSGKEKCYSDCKNAGDLALKVGFKKKEDGTITAKKNWQTYTLAYMMQNPDKGMQEDLYKAMVVAYKLGLLGDTTEARWDEPIDKSEAIQLMINTFLALNKTTGYRSFEEYGTIVENKTTASMSEDGVV